jgi:microcystin degradation protein MlrC
MKIALAELVQETDTFSAITTSVVEFQNYEIFRGNDVVAKSRGVGPLGGFLAVAEQQDDFDSQEFVSSVRAWAGAGGTILDETFQEFADEIVAGISNAGNLDAVFLSLHGAAAAESTDDVEGYVLEHVRHAVSNRGARNDKTTGPDIPIVVSLDHHANITERMVAAADVLVGHETQPHDPLATGVKAAGILFSILKGNITPTIAWQKIPMITPQDQFLTAAGPMKEWFDKAREFEQLDNVIDVSPYPMQPWLDVEESGWSVVVHTNNDHDLAVRIANEMADWAWTNRERFRVSERVAVVDAIQQATDAEDGLIILSDTGDSVFGGAPGNSVHILNALLKNSETLNHDRLFLVPIIDTVALDIVFARGLGNNVQVEVGSRIEGLEDLVSVDGEVVSISSGYNADIGERGKCELGRTAVIAVGAVRLVLLEERSFAINHPVLYEHHGIDVARAKAVVVKTASNFQFFAAWRKQLIRVDSPGATQSDLVALPWKKLRRPIWPFDESMEWQANAE